MSKNDRNGVSAEIARTVAAGSAVLTAEADAQAELFEPAGRRLTVEEATAERRAGRPKGAQSKATREFRDWMGAMGLDPARTLARWLMLSPEELAARLEIKPVEAFDRQASIATQLLPYLHSKLAHTDQQGNAVPLFNMVIGGGSSGNVARAPWLDEIEQNQGVIDGVPVLSKVDQSKVGGE